MFDGQTSYKACYIHKCEKCSSEIRYSIDNVLFDIWFMPGTGYKIVVYKKCDKCGCSQKISM